MTTRSNGPTGSSAAAIDQLLRSREVSFFDYAADDSFVSDPITPLMDLACSAGPVVRGRGNRFGGVAVSNHFLLPDDRDGFLILGFDAAQKVLTEPSFSSEQGYTNSYGQTFGRVLFTIDEPDHAHYRKLVTHPFSVRQVHALWLDRHIAPMIDRRIALFVHRGRGDLLTEFAMPFPYEVIASITGIPLDLELPLAQLVNDMLEMGKDPARALAALGPINDLMLEVIAQHRREPKDDLITALVDTEVEGVRLTDIEIASFIRQMIAAGLDTTYRGTGTLLWALLEHPDQLRRVADDRSLVAGAVEEALRVAPPAGAVPRVATQDVVVEGIPIPAGSPVLVALSAANHDENRFPDPLAFDIARKPNRHLTFGLGAHFCLGLNVAREEMRYALNAVLDLLPNLRKDPTAWSGANLHGWAFRSPTKLPAAWDVEPARKVAHQSPRRALS
jgi:cytochrome P450